MGDQENNGRRSIKGKAFLALGWFAIALQAWNFYLFTGLIGK